MKIEHIQWVVTDRASLTTVTQQSDKLIENLVSAMPELTRHHYTARYLKESKENLPSDQCIILADFSELFIYTPRCYNGVLTWQHSQLILRPIIVYIKDQHLQTLSF
jgi:hypothetical protein